MVLRIGEGNPSRRFLRISQFNRDDRYPCELSKSRSFVSQSMKRITSGIAFLDELYRPFEDSDGEETVWDDVDSEFELEDDEQHSVENVERERSPSIYTTIFSQISMSGCDTQECSICLSPIKLNDQHIGLLFVIYNIIFVLTHLVQCSPVVTCIAKSV